jgi:enoyl-[acyl-carrier protein] reductase I
MDFLAMNNRNVLVFGVANRRSVATAVAARLREAGARVLFAVRDDALREKNARFIGDSPVFVCDLEKQADIDALPGALRAAGIDEIHGIVHSVAFANYSGGFVPFHATERRDFLQAVDISCFSLTAAANALRDCLAADASIVTMSISTTRMASESYGYMGPIKAALDSTVVFLAKSLSASVSPDIRVNAVGAGLLKTSSSAGIPGYVDAYLYAEKVIPRGRALATEEAADAVVFLLSPRSSGINAQTITVDAGMSVNYFDRNLVRRGVGGPQA